MSLRLLQVDNDPDVPFPPVEHALAEPDGLLAFGGDLSPQRLLNAYRHGIFPWFSDGEPILWWSPSRRAVFRTDGVRLSSRFRRGLRTSRLVVRADTAFDAVIDACAHNPRPGQSGGTWITRGMIQAYGRLFCGESMFSAQSGASTIALASLARRLNAWDWPLIDAQVPNDHTRQLGVETWSRDAYLQALEGLRDATDAGGNWTARFGECHAAALADPAAA